MTRSEAGQVVAVLVAGFPALTLEAESVDVFVAALEELGDQELALEVAHRIVRTRPKFPALSELLDEYHAVRRRRERVQAPPEPTERDLELIAQIRAFADALKLRLCDADELPPPLPLATPGACDDGCGYVGDRVQSGTLQLCQPCALARIRVGAKLEREPEPAPQEAAATAAAA